MSEVRITLFDFDLEKDKPKEPLHMAVQYDPNLSLQEQGTKKVSIFCGDYVSGGTVTLPLAMLTQIISALMQEDLKRQSNIIIPDNGIILPN